MSSNIEKLIIKVGVENGESKFAEAGRAALLPLLVVASLAAEASSHVKSLLPFALLLWIAWNFVK